MKAKFIPFYYALFLFLFFTFSCTLEGRLGSDATTNSVVTNYLTNNYSPSGAFSADNVSNEDFVQPTFLVSGTLTGEAASLIENGGDSLTFTVTNSGETGKGLVWGSGTVKYWQAVLFSQFAYDYIHVSFVADLGVNGSLAYNMNFRITNLPAYTFDSSYDGLLTNASTIDIGGHAHVVAPDYIEGVYLEQVTSSGADTNVCSGTYTALRSPGWTNTVTNCRWLYSGVALGDGENLFYGYAVSHDGITNTVSPFTVTKALIGVDAVFDAAWNTAPVAGTSDNGGMNGYQINNFRITNDSANIYFWVDAVNVPDGARISVAIDTNSASGLTNDAWGGLFTYAMANGMKPDFDFQCRIASSGGHALYSVNGTAWTNVANNWGLGMNGVQMAADRTTGFEIGAPLSLLGLAPGSVVNAIVILSGLDGNTNNCQAWDVIPESADNGIDSTVNSFGAVEKVWCNAYTVQ